MRYRVGLYLSWKNWIINNIEYNCSPRQHFDFGQADWEVVQKTLIATFSGDYVFHWSLADWKYSGEDWWGFSTLGMRFFIFLSHLAGLRFYLSQDDMFQILLSATKGDSGSLRNRRWPATCHGKFKIGIWKWWLFEWMMMMLRIPTTPPPPFYCGGGIQLPLTFRGVSSS